MYKSKKIRNAQVRKFSKAAFFFKNTFFLLDFFDSSISNTQHLLLVYDRILCEVNSRHVLCTAKLLMMTTGFRPEGHTSQTAPGVTMTECRTTTAGKTDFTTLLGTYGFG